MPRSPLRAFGLVFVGGVLGTVLRIVALSANTGPSYGAFYTSAWTSFVPWRLIVINTLGVFVAAYVLSGPLRGPGRGLTRALVVPGILGGLTSYSALFTDAHVLWGQSPTAAVDMVIGSLLVGVAAAWAGQRVSR